MESKGTFNAYPILKAGSAILFGEGEIFEVALDTFKSTVKKWLESRLVLTAAFATTTASGGACPSVSWEPNCVTIERGDIEINGKQWRAKGDTVAYRIKDGKLFGKIH